MVVGQPRFQVQDKVTYVPTGETGTVIGRFHEWFPMVRILLPTGHTRELSEDTSDLEEIEEEEHSA